MTLFMHNLKCIIMQSPISRGPYCDSDVNSVTEAYVTNLFFISYFLLFFIPVATLKDPGI